MLQSLVDRLTNLGYYELLDWENVYMTKLRVDGQEYQAYRVIHSTALGPSKGGIRFHPNVDEHELKMLSLLMSLKNSLVELPYGGAKGGIKVDPKNLSIEQLKKLSKEYAIAFSDIIGTWKDIPAPDVNTNSQIIAWMLDAYQISKDTKEAAMFTSKPVELGGIAFREISTSYGGFVIIEYIAKEIEKRNISIAIQGSGNVGGNLAEMLYNAGFKVVAISDSNSAIYDPEGLDIKKVLEYKKINRTFHGYNAEQIDNATLLELDVDILAPAALELQINEKNVHNIKAKWIIEMANNPIDWKVDEQLNSIVVPDILANSGGVIGSYMEWVYNITGNYMDENTMKDNLKYRILNKFKKLLSLGINKMRDNAIKEAAERIIKAKRLRK